MQCYPAMFDTKFVFGPKEPTSVFLVVVFEKVIYKPVRIGPRKVINKVWAFPVQAR